VVQAFVEQKETSLAESLKKAADFITPTEIYVEDNEGNCKGRGEERDQVRVEQGQRGAGWDQHFDVYPHSIFIEIKGHRMLKKPPPMALWPKP